MDILFRPATIQDLSAIVHMLADDDLGGTRETAPSRETVAPEYVAAFYEIERDPNNEVIVGEHKGRIIAFLQLTYIPNLVLKGTKRVLIESVRVSSDFRGKGIGRQLFQFAFQRARGRGCGLAQLTSNKKRADAIRFYESLGFTATHEGLKVQL